MARRHGGERFDVRAECRRVGVSTKTFYKYLDRFAAEGVSGLYPRSRRPASSPSRVDPAVEEALVRARKVLAEDGWDAGAEQIAFWILDHPRDWPAGARLPSRATINRVLARRGLVVPMPQRRPTRSRHRFEAATPNTLWQLDGFGCRLADGTPVTILQIIDDCSRMDLALAAVPSENSADVWATVLATIARHGPPARLLTDNGTAFSGRRRGWVSHLEENLRTLGVVPITSTIGHPQTCGKVERDHRTCQQWLAARPPAPTMADLQDLLDTYRDHYNHRRRKTHLGGLTPAQRHDLGPRDGPGDHPTPWPVHIGTAPVTTSGCLAAYGYQLGIGRAHAGTTVTVIKQHHAIAVLAGHQLLAQFTLTTHQGRRRYLPRQPLPLPKS